MRKLVFTFSTLIILVLLSAYVVPLNINQNFDDKVELEILLDMEKGTCEFKVTNGSKKKIHTSCFPGKYNMIYAFDYNDTPHSFYDSERGTVIIKPGETKSWEYNYFCKVISRAKGRDDINKFKFYWSMIDVSNKLISPSNDYKNKYKEYKSKIIEVEL